MGEVSKPLCGKIEGCKACCSHPHGMNSLMKHFLDDATYEISFGHHVVAICKVDEIRHFEKE
jgi:hypothetical protein